MTWWIPRHTDTEYIYHFKHLSCDNIHFPVSCFKTSVRLRSNKSVAQYVVALATIQPKERYHRKMHNHYGVVKKRPLVWHCGLCSTQSSDDALYTAWACELNKSLCTFTSCTKDYKCFDNVSRELLSFSWRWLVLTTINSADFNNDHQHTVQLAQNDILPTPKVLSLTKWRFWLSITTSLIHPLKPSPYSLGSPCGKSARPPANKQPWTHLTNSFIWLVLHAVLHNISHLHQQSGFIWWKEIE